MANAVDDLCEEFNIDFEIEEDFEVDFDLLQQYNVYDSVEIEVPDDITYEELEKVEVELDKLPVLEDDEDDTCSIDETLDEDEVGKKVPTLTFISEETVTVKTTTAESFLVCSKCGKRYKKKSYFVKHQGICGE